MLIATTFSMVWVIYAIVLLATVFLIKPGLKIKANRKNRIRVVRYELLGVCRRTPNNFIDSVDCSLKIEKSW
jgi:hypothetical protein